MDDLVKSRYNPWREFIENVITGDNYFRASEYMQLLEYMDRDAAEIERQREEVEALRADAERWRWLRMFSNPVVFGRTWPMGDRKELDAAIDAAMKAGE